LDVIARAEAAPLRKGHARGHERADSPENQAGILSSKTGGESIETRTCVTSEHGKRGGNPYGPLQRQGGCASARWYVPGTGRREGVSATPQTTERWRPWRREDAGELAEGGWRGPPRNSMYLVGVSRQPNRETGCAGASLSRLGPGVPHVTKQRDVPPRQVQRALLGRQGSLRARCGDRAGGQWGRGANVAGAAAAGRGRCACPRARAPATLSLPSMSLPPCAAGRLREGPYREARARERHAEAGGRWSSGAPFDASLQRLSRREGR
jgi:hypothetical protein